MTWSKPGYYQEQRWPPGGAHTPSQRPSCHNLVSPCSLIKSEQSYEQAVCVCACVCCRLAHSVCQLVCKLPTLAERHAPAETDLIWYVVFVAEKVSSRSFVALSPLKRSFAAVNQLSGTCSEIPTVFECTAVQQWRCQRARRHLSADRRSLSAAAGA